MLTFILAFPRDKVASAVGSFSGDPVVSRRPTSTTQLSGTSSTRCVLLPDDLESHTQDEQIRAGSSSSTGDGGDAQSLQKQITELGSKVSTIATENKTKGLNEITVARSVAEASPQQFMNAIASSSDLKLMSSASRDEWSTDQRALYSLISPAGDEVDSWGDPDTESALLAFPPEAGERDRRKGDVASNLRSADEAAVGKSFAIPSVVDPRHLDEGAMKKKLETLKSRRRSLIGEVPEGLVESPSSIFGDESVLGSKSEVSVATIMNELQMDVSSNWIGLSLKRARVIDYRNDHALRRGSAITTNAESLITAHMHCPYKCRPFIGMQQAFNNLDYPPCPRCGSPMPSAEAANDPPLCDDCYSSIYLYYNSPASQGLSGEYWSQEGRAEKKRMDVLAADKAASVSANLLQEQIGVKGRGVRRMRPYATAAPTSSEQQENAASTKTGPPSRNIGSSHEDGSAGNNRNEPPSPPPKTLQRDDGWNVQASLRSLRTINPIRNLVQNITVTPNPEMGLIKLSIGDPTVYGNLNVSDKAIEKFCEVMRNREANGYSMSMGSVAARQAVAKRYTSKQSPLTEEDVVLAGGTSGALELALGAMANEGDNVLLPCPGFPLFQTIAEGYGIECRYYAVNPEESWEIELGDLMQLADSRTSAIVVNNPSNPCGSVFSETHIEDLLAAASALRIPIIADEVYADMVFSSQTFTSIGAKSVDVPVLSVGGVSKQFAVPGWRLGWVLIHDRQNILKQGGVRSGLRQLTTRMLVPNTPAQAVLPTLLAEGRSDPAFRALMRELEDNAEFTMQALKGARGLRCVAPQGAMYVMAEVDVGKLGMRDSMEFTERLLEEEAVFVLPGECFRAKNFVRIVFAAPREVLSEAFHRIRTFCSRHAGGM